ncbi:MAG: hypothetical protein Harvfovirus20_3 [Harvfovirus sp.]|uniref:Uncharacterized protein n=1 Tax=Harvfovirus sp. TaxID=2487768 RepID=A0A3G5A3X6_9VIRU|nr:MAG: hypothetical protein Harvfovirus20_3 [Harvfovirus sp.]
METIHSSISSDNKRFLESCANYDLDQIFIMRSRIDPLAVDATGQTSLELLGRMRPDHEVKHLKVAELLISKGVKINSPQKIILFNHPPITDFSKLIHFYNHLIKFYELVFSITSPNFSFYYATDEDTCEAYEEGAQITFLGHLLNKFPYISSQLLKKNTIGFDLEYSKSDFDETPLLSSARLGSWGQIDQLLKLGANKYALNDEGENLFSCAADNFDLIYAILSNGVYSSSDRDFVFNCQSLHHSALTAGRDDICQLIHKILSPPYPKATEDPQISVETSTPTFKLLEAYQRDNIKKFKIWKDDISQLVHKIRSPPYPKATEITPTFKFLDACQQGNIKDAKILLEENEIDVNELYFGHNALSLLAASITPQTSDQLIDFTKLLLSLGCDVHNKEGRHIPIICASKNLYLQYGDVFEENKFSDSKVCFEYLKILIEAGADIFEHPRQPKDDDNEDDRSDGENDYLSYEAEDSSGPAVKLLTQYAPIHKILLPILTSCKIPIPYEEILDKKYGYTLLHLAVKYNRPDLMTFLIEKGANIGTVSHDMSTILITACKFRKDSLASSLLKFLFNKEQYHIIFQRNSLGKSFLEYTLQFNCEETLDTCKDLFTKKSLEEYGFTKSMVMTLMIC